jgi:hypothetical protein
MGETAMTNPPTDERGIPPATMEYRLRAMAMNYSGGHSWDHLDTETCLQAADELSSLKAALSHQGEVGGWQPIATAPEDVPVLVGWWDDGEQVTDFDKLEEGCWFLYEERREHFLCVAPPESRGPSEKAPYTHWMHVPTVPKGDLTALISKAEKV